MRLAVCSNVFGPGFKEDLFEKLTYHIYLIKRPRRLFQTWHRGPCVYLTPEAWSTSLFMKQWFFFIIFIDINRSILSAAYYTPNKYLRGIFKNPPWRPGVYLKPGVQSSKYGAPVSMEVSAMMYQNSHNIAIGAYALNLKLLEMT